MLYSNLQTVEQRKDFLHFQNYNSENIDFSRLFRLSPMDFKKAAGQRIEAARLKKGWDLQKLADESGLLYKRIDHYEKGRRQIAPAEAVTLSKALGVKPGYLMALDDSDMTYTSLEEALVKNWRTMNEADRMEWFRKLEIKALQNRDPVSNARVEKAIGPSPKPTKVKK